MTVAEPPDRATILAAVMPALLATQASASEARPNHDDGATGFEALVATRRRVVAGTYVAREAFGRLGARFRPVVDEGDEVAAGDVVAEVGGPVAASRRGAPVAIAFLDRLSAVASGLRPPDHEDALEVFAASFANAAVAARLSPSASVDDDGPSFRLRSEG